MFWWTLLPALAQPLAAPADADALLISLRSHVEASEALGRAAGLALHASRGEDPCTGDAAPRARRFLQAWRDAAEAAARASDALSAVREAPTLAPLQAPGAIDPVATWRARAERTAGAARGAIADYRLTLMRPLGRCPRAVAPAEGFPTSAVRASDDPPPLRAVWITAPGALCGRQGALEVAEGPALVEGAACWAPDTSCACTPAWPLDGAALGAISP